MTLRMLLVIVMLCSAAAGGFAQDKPRTTEAPASGGGGWSAALSLANVYEGNVNHDVTPLQSYGLVPAFDVAFTAPTSGFTFAYEIAGNRYTGTNEWDRVSQAMESSLRRNLGKRVRLDATAEASFKGTSEDRELANMVGVSPRATFVLSKRTRVSVSGAWRYKAYPDEPGTSGPSPSAGMKLDRRFASSRLTVGYKYQTRQSQAVRNRYQRSMYTGEFTMPLGGAANRLSVELEYRTQRYQRLIKVAGQQVLRRDRRLAADAHYDYTIGPRTFIRWTYAFERRRSNDPSKDFFAPIAAMTVHYQLR